ncbi:hypothetical protein V8E36_009544, partial [Tilletia maclaganii]
DAKPKSPLFSYLLRFIHREGSFGELARAGLLNLIHVALAPGFAPVVGGDDGGSQR